MDGPLQDFMLTTSFIKSKANMKIFAFVTEHFAIAWVSILLDISTDPKYFRY